MSLNIKTGDEIDRQRLIAKLANMQYSRNDISLSRNDFLSSGINYSTSMCNLFISGFVYL